MFIHNSQQRLILASGSATRRRTLESCLIDFQQVKPSIDERAIQRTCREEKISPAAVAGRLARLKALDVGKHNPEALTIGCDQTLDFEGRVYPKARSVVEARSVLRMLRGRAHVLHASAVICEGCSVVWQHRSSVHMTMRPFTDSFLDAYLACCGQDILSSAGCYRIEKEGILLFSAIDGDWHAILGMPLVEMLGFLQERGTLKA